MIVMELLTKTKNYIIKLLRQVENTMLSLSLFTSYTELLGKLLA